MSIIKLTPVESIIQQARMDICRACPKFIKLTRTCKPWPVGCGCFLPAKTRMMRKKCPDGKWTAMSEQDIEAVLLAASED